MTSKTSLIADANVNGNVNGNETLLVIVKPIIRHGKFVIIQKYRTCFSKVIPCFCMTYDGLSLSHITTPYKI